MRIVGVFLTRSESVFDKCEYEGVFSACIMFSVVFDSELVIPSHRSTKLDFGKLLGTQKPLAIAAFCALLFE